MNFQDKEKQERWEAFCAWYILEAKQPTVTGQRSLLNQLRDIGVKRFGNGAFQELLRSLTQQRAQAQPQQERVLLGKAQGGGNESRRSPSPTAKAPQKAEPRGKRLERLIQRGVIQPADKSAASEVVAGGRPKKNLIEAATETIAKTVKEAGATADELSSVHLSTGAAFNVEEQRTENNLLADAATHSAKELVELYGRDLIFEKLVSMGESADALEEKSDRQLANLLKKKAAE